VAGGQLVPVAEQQADSATADTGPLSWLVLAGEPAAAPTTEPAVPVEADDEDDEELDVDEQICVDELAIDAAGHHRPCVHVQTDARTLSLHRDANVGTTGQGPGPPATTLDETHVGA
jgi:hypothetical protein